MAKNFNLKTVSSGRTASEVKNDILKNSKNLESNSKILETSPANPSPSVVLHEPRGENQKISEPIQAPPENNQAQAVIEASPRSSFDIQTDRSQTVVRPQSDRSQTVVAKTTVDRSQTVVRPQSDRSQTVVKETVKDRSQTVVRPQLDRSQDRSQTVVGQQLSFEFFPLMGEQRKKLFIYVAKRCMELGSLVSDGIKSSELVKAASIGGQRPMESLRDALKKMESKGYFDRVERLSIGHDGLNKFWLNLSIYQAFLTENLHQDRSQTVVKTVVERSSSNLINTKENTTTTEDLGSRDRSDWLDVFDIKKFNDPDVTFRFELDSGLKNKLRERGMKELELLTTVLAYARDAQKSKKPLSVLFGCLRNGQPYNSENWAYAEKKALRLLNLQPTEQSVQVELDLEEDELNAKVSEFMRSNRAQYDSILASIRNENKGLSELAIHSQAIELIKAQISSSGHK